MVLPSVPMTAAQLLTHIAHFKAAGGAKHVAAGLWVFRRSLPNNILAPIMAEQRLPALEPSVQLIGRNGGWTDVTTVRGVYVAPATDLAVSQMFNATVGRSAPERMQAVRAAALRAGPLLAAGGDGGEGASLSGRAGVLHPGRACVELPFLAALLSYLGRVGLCAAARSAASTGDIQTGLGTIRS
jgi:hypothetical protein